MNKTMQWEGEQWEGEQGKGEAPAEPVFDQNKTQIASAQSNATQFSANVNCPVCETPNPPSETYCIDCGFVLSAAPVALEDMPKQRDMGRLVTSDGTREFALKPGENSVGRENADILLIHNSVSRAHAKIVAGDDCTRVQDIGSTNGTYVDGGRISGNEPVEIADGAELTFGSLTLKYIAPLAPIEESDQEVPEAVPDEVAAEVIEAEPVAIDTPSPPEEGEGRGEGVDDEVSTPVAALVSKDESLRFPIIEGTNTIGRRDGANTIVIPDSFVSGRHADLELDNGAFTITDIGSTNGTLVNGVKLEPNAPKEIRDGDEITIGQKVFRIEVG